MEAQFDNNLNASFFLWAENRIAQRGQAYITVTTPLYYTPDTTLPASHVGYSSPWKGWVYDSGVSGAHIIQSISGGGYSSPLDRSSGVMFDYPNGRVIVPAAWGTSLALTGTYSFFEVNTYLPEEDDDPLLTTAKFYRNPRFNGAATSGVPPHQPATPAVFINTLKDDSQPFALGGLQDCYNTFSLTCLLESNYQLNAILSIFRDAKEKYFPLVPITADPLNEAGDLRGGTGYNYQTLIEQYGQPGNLVYIENVRTSKVSDRVKMNPTLFGGVIDVTVTFVRQTT